MAQWKVRYHWSYLRLPKGRSIPLRSLSPIHVYQSQITLNCMLLCRVGEYLVGLWKPWSRSCGMKLRQKTIMFTNSLSPKEKEVSQAKRTTRMWVYFLRPQLNLWLIDPSLGQVSTQSLDRTAPSRRQLATTAANKVGGGDAGAAPFPTSKPTCSFTNRDSVCLRPPSTQTTSMPWGLANTQIHTP